MTVSVQEPLLNRLQDCCVRILANHGSDFGTGFFVAEGIIATCAHVVGWSDLNAIEIYWRNTPPFSALTVLLPTRFDRTRDPDNLFSGENPCPDVALLKVSAGEHPSVFMSPSAHLNDDLYIYGYSDEHPEGDPITTKLEGFSRNNQSFKLKIGQVRPGISGSPALNLRTGAVIGLVTETRDLTSDLGGRGISLAAITQAFPDLAEQAAEYQRRRGDWFMDLSTSQHKELERDIGGLTLFRVKTGSLTIATLTLLLAVTSSARAPSNMFFPFRSIGLSYAIVSDVISDPSGVLWVATADQGVFAYEEGRAWTPRDIGFNTKRVTALAYSRNQKRLYAGTDDGLWVSDDDGHSWTRGHQRFAGKEILCIVLSAKDPDLQIVGTLRRGGTIAWSATEATLASSSSFVSGDEGEGHISTDNGKTWKTWPLKTTNSAALSSSDTRIAYLASEESGLYMTRDRFSTVEKVANFPKDQKPLSVGISDERSLIVVGTVKGGLWTSADAGASWQHVAVTEDTKISGVAFSPQDPKRALAAGRVGVFESNDGGYTWATSNEGLDYSWARRVGFTNSADEYVGTDGFGIYLRRHSQKNWLPWNHGFPLMPVLSTSALTTDHWFAASALGLFETRDGGESWQSRGVPGEPVPTFVVAKADVLQEHDSHLFISKSGGTGYSSGEHDDSEYWWGTQAGRLYNRRKNSNQYQLIREFREKHDFPAPIRSLILGPNSRVIVVAEQLPLQVSEDAGKTWNSLGEDEVGTWINGAFQSTANPAKTYVATIDRGLLVTEDGGKHWERSQLPLPDPVTSVAESSTESGLVYAATVQGNVLRSIDNGRRFDVIRYSKTTENQWAFLVAHPRRKGTLLLGTQFGAFVTTNDGKSWRELRLGVIGTAYYTNSIEQRDDEGTAFLLSTSEGLFLLSLDSL